MKAMLPLSPAAPSRARSSGLVNPLAARRDRLCSFSGQGTAASLLWPLLDASSVLLGSCASQASPAPNTAGCLFKGQILLATTSKSCVGGGKQRVTTPRCSMVLPQAPPSVPTLFPGLSFPSRRGDGCHRSMERKCLQRPDGRRLKSPAEIGAPGAGALPSSGRDLPQIASLASPGQPGSALSQLGLAARESAVRAPSVWAVRCLSYLRRHRHL